MQFADGRKAANFISAVASAPLAAPGVVQLTGGVAGGLQYRNWSYWVWPLPPPGPVTFAYEWRAVGIGEVRFCLDGQLIVDAAAHSVRVWA